MSAIDLARSLLPPRLRTRLVRRMYSLIPLERRMGNDYWQLRAFLREAQWWDRLHIEGWQLKRFKEIVRHAHKNVPGYSTLFREAGVTPDDITSLHDVRLLPFTTKEIIRDNLKDFTARNISSWQHRYVTTGGSTGIPFGFYHTPTNEWMENAFVHSSWERAGWRMGDMSGVLRGAFVGSEEQFWDYDLPSRQLLLSTYYLRSHTYSRYMDKLEEYHPKHLQAYPSAATMLADLVLQNDDIGRIDFDVILLGSENIYAWQMAKLHKAFPQARLFGWYGHCEQAVFAPWCECSATYHTWPFYGLTEILDRHDAEVQEGDVGEIVGTSFWSYATPFIRYRTMDLARKGAGRCSKCHREFQILDAIDGRLQEFVVSNSGRLISMTAINMHSDVFDRVKQFQFYQDTPGKVELRVVRNAGYKDTDTGNIRRQLAHKLGKDIQIEVMFVDQIGLTAKGKYRFLEQKLHLTYGD